MVGLELHGVCRLCNHTDVAKCKHGKRKELIIWGANFVTDIIVRFCCSMRMFPSCLQDFHRRVVPSAGLDRVIVVEPLGRSLKEIVQFEKARYSALQSPSVYYCYCMTWMVL